MKMYKINMKGSVGDLCSLRRSLLFLQETKPLPILLRGTAPAPCAPSPEPGLGTAAAATGMSSPPHCRDPAHGRQSPTQDRGMHQNLLRKSWRGQAKVISANDLLIARPKGAQRRHKHGCGARPWIHRSPGRNVLLAGCQGCMAGRMHLFSCSIAGNRPPAGSCGWDPACSGCSGVLRGCCLHEVPGCVGAAQWPWARAGTAGHHHCFVMCPPVWGRGQETPSTSPPASPRGTQQEELDGDPQSQRAPAPSCPTAQPGYRPRLSDYRNVFFFSLHTMDRPSWELLAFSSELTNGLGRALARSRLPPPWGLGSGAPVLPLGCGDTAAPGRPRCEVWETERVVRARCEEQEGRRKSFNTEQVSGEPKLCCFLLIMKYS